MKLTKNFSLSEMLRSTTADRLHLDNNPSETDINNLELLAENILQPLRDVYCRPIIVTSGYRSPALNKAINGAKNSQHMLGQAADIIPSLIKGMSREQETRKLFQLIQALSLPFDQLIDEKNYSWIHVSHGPRHRRQVLHLT